jgi:hypothetical protein
MLHVYLTQRKFLQSRYLETAILAQLFRLSGLRERNPDTQTKVEQSYLEKYISVYLFVLYTFQYYFTDSEQN